jgi:hypothetical protein
MVDPHTLHHHTLGLNIGHKDIRMTLRYSHLSREHLQAAAGTLDQSFEVGTKREQATNR